MKRFDAYVRILTQLAEQQNLRLDANETAVFARQLEDIDSTIYRVQYPELKGTLLVPAKSDINPGAEDYTYRVMDYAGEAQPIGNYADDLPRVDVQGREVTTKLKGFGDSYGYSIQDMRRARMAGLGLETERAMAARDVLARKLDDVIATGYSDLGITGFTNNADVALVTPATGTWLTATADQICDDLFKLERAIITTSKGVEMPDTAVLPPSLYGLATTKRIANTDISALDYFLKKSQGIKNIEPWYKLETAGAGSVPRIVGYRRDPSKLQALVPVEFEQFPPQAKNMAFSVNCHMRCGGVAFRFPGSARYMDGC